MCLFGAICGDPCIVETCPKDQVCLPDFSGGRPSASCRCIPPACRPDWLPDTDSFDFGQVVKGLSDQLDFEKRFGGGKGPELRTTVTASEFNKASTIDSSPAFLCVLLLSLLA